MSTKISLKSREQFLGDMIRTVLNNTDLNSVVRGSDIAVLLEAISESLNQVQVSSLKILEAINLSALVGTALEKKAISMRIPNGQGGFGKKPALQASGPIVIGSSFTKISSKLYSGKPSPFAGSTTLFVENAFEFPGSGSVYIGRGTLNRFEGPIPYTSVANNGSFWTITLSSPLTKSHLQSDLVTFAQGGNRTIPAGTAVQVPSNNESPAINFRTTANLTIPDGESEGTVNAICDAFGTSGNVLTNAIKAFTSTPFTGATVRNSNTFRNGQSVESDEDLRQRIKNYPFTLSRGTNQAILSAIQGATDPDTGRSIKSAVILDPVEPGDFARVFIDDGTGLEPTFDNQAYELLLKSATGVEKRHRATQFPIISAMMEGAESAPFVLSASMSITVQVDEISEQYFITPSNYRNLSSASAYEIVRDLNSQSNLLGFRTTDEGTRIIGIDLSGDAERIIVQPGDLQSVLGFSTSELRTVFLYKNSELLSFRGHTATLETRSRNLWNLDAADLTDVRVRVDNVIQTISISDADFADYDSTIDNATIASWATVLSQKIAGVKFTTSGQIMTWSTYNSFNPSGQLEILTTKADGTPAGWIGDDKMWLSESSGGMLVDVGASKDFDFNRFTGEITLLARPDDGDTLEIATADTRAFKRTAISETGLFSLDPSLTTVGNSKLIVGFDGIFSVRDVSVAPGAEITPTEPDNVNATNVIRLTANDVGMFSESVVGDYFYLLKDLEAVGTVLPTDAEGMYRILSRGFNQTATDIVHAGLLGNTQVYLSVNISTEKDSNLVTVNFTDHGLRTGDLVTTSHSGGTIGGLTNGDLTVLNQAIVVLDENKFTFQAGALATSTVSGVLSQYGHNLILVEHTLHGIQTGAIVDVLVGVGFGGITSGDLTVTDADIQIIDADSYYYRASAAATSTSSNQTITSVTQLADTWVEFEVSDADQLTWSGMLSNDYGMTSKMLHIFRSDNATPQLIDFGNAVSSETADSVVSIINSQISAGKAVKFSPQQVEIRSNSFNKEGTVAILAVIGNAINLYETPEADTAIQSHIGFVKSDFTDGAAPVVTDIELPTASSAGYPTRTYLKIDKNITNVTLDGSDPEIESPTAYNPDYPVGFQHMWITGKGEGFVGRVYNNQTAAPYTGIMTGADAIKPIGTFDDTQTNPDTLNRYSNLGLRLQDLPVNNKDSLVIEMDLDPIDKTVSVPMAKLAEILDMDTLAGSGKGQVISFRLLDPEDSNKPFFDTSSVYKDFDFRDFKILTKSVGLYREDVSDRALIVRSVDYGAVSQLRLSLRLPVEPDQADFLVTHTTDFYNDLMRLNLICTIPSDAVIAGSVIGSGTYRVTPTASGTLYDLRISHPFINAGGEYVVGDVLNIQGSVAVSSSYEITGLSGGQFLGATANTTNLLSTVSVVYPGHGLQTGDIISVSTGVAIGGISPINLSVNYVPVTYLSPSVFEYTATASATSNDSGTLSTVSAGVVTVKSPGNAGIVSSATFDASVAPIRAFELLDSTLITLADAINAYLPSNPVATAETIGTNLATTFIAEPTYMLYPAATAWTEASMSGALNHHSFNCKYSGSAGIWQYDSSNALLNNIKATVQSDDSIYPTAAEASGTSYSPVGEQVQIVPTNSKSLSAWINFNAVSSLSLLADIERTNNSTKVQIASKELGSDGAVSVTGVTANGVEAEVIGNGSSVNDAIRMVALSSAVQSLMPGQLINAKNSISSNILRAYRDVPTGASVTTSNTTDIISYFRPENSIKYIRVSPTVGRLVFLRSGMGAGQTEPLDVGNDITLTNLGNGLVQVTSDIGTGGVGTGKLAARTGDMMYIQPDSTFDVSARCKTIGSAGRTSPTLPEYTGYPVVHVIDDENVIIIAPNITSFGLTTLTTTTDVVFIPALYNEKNIRSNHKEGAKFDSLNGDGKAFYLIKALGNGLVSMFLQNSATEATDSMELDVLSVNTDDYLTLGDGFDPANQGTFRIVGHNGRNHILMYNPEGGKNELIDSGRLSSGGQGGRVWSVGPLEDGINRSIRVVSSDSVRIGDFVTISSPASVSQWFNNSFFGSWPIVGLGYQAFDYTGDPLPHTPSDGTYDQAFFAPYVDFTMSSAPVSVTDSGNNNIDSFLIAGNAASINFTEGTPYQSFKYVSGHAVNNQNTTNRDLYLRPKKDVAKLSASFGTQIVGLSKTGFDERVFLGIDGYKVYSGLVQQAHRIIDGLPQNTISFPGVKAAGTTIEVQTPLFRSVQISLQIRPTDGVTLNSITELVRSTVDKYVLSLGAGRPVVISEIQRVVQSLPGVFSIKVLSTLPTADDDRIVVSEQEKALIIDAEKDIVIG